ncbi:MAG: coproporphyrinogen dehydrogenase HemZ [Oscillospiraceae bacterium]|nr:coproporphyrinogen dehydrogenase HemZ [Oscillospiraceae bacterium]
MRLSVNNFRYEMEKLTREFFPDEKLEIIESEPVSDCELITELTDKITVSVNLPGFTKTLTAPLCENNELQMGRMLYSLLGEYTGFYLKWGVLTGVRPSKMLILTEKKLGRENAEKHFKNDLLVSDEKYELARSVADHEEKIIALSADNSYSLYISIPFCPTRCSYCSFVSHSVETKKARELLPKYTDLLLKELEITGEIAARLGLRLESVYVGGGTPTTLSAEQLKMLLTTVGNNFDLSSCREFTVEAGRPDTITEEKLTVLKNSPVDRISINPQTFCDSVLQAIGRRHSAQDTVDAFMLARKLGFDNINMDLIAGLPTDTFESFCRSLDTAVSLQPENITVHTLAVKRASNIGANSPEVAAENAESVAKMIDYTYEKLKANYHPYYMYRQSKSAGSLENTGWCVKGKECLYNVFMMEECHTILSCGGGAVTKLKAPQVNEIERIFNFKYPFEYISGFSELTERKKRISEFYNTYS